MPSLSWSKAVRVLGPKLAPDDKALPDWPSALEFWKIAVLQYPGNDRKDRDNQAALIDSLNMAAVGGELSTEKRELQRPIFKDEWVPRRPALGSKAWGSEFGVSIRQTEYEVRKVRDGFETYHVQVVSREAFRLWFDAQGELPSEHVQAWLRPLVLAEEVSHGSVESTRVKRKTKHDLVEDWLHECERRAKDIEVLFDRTKMPGTKNDFLTLLRALDPEFENTNTVASLDTYLEGRCKFSGGRPKSALPLYARLFPESRKLNPGVVMPLRMKS
ncbi:hypothetical protein [Zoogloea sp.]|uniref:hypothetical protein n=1 Tax=Zoogloea sp. TaxID=49181 RepID=UPI0035B06148